MTTFADNKFIEFVVRQYSDMVMRIAFQYTRNKSDAEDLTQEVFLQLIKQPPFETEEHLKHWLIRSSINKCKNHLRTIKRRNTVPLDDNYHLTDQVNFVFNELQNLSEKDRTIIYLYYYEGYSAKEIADIFAKKESAIFMRLNRAREKLKKFLEE